MKNKETPELLRETSIFTNAMQNGKMKWQKERNKMSHLTPKKKSRKKQSHIFIRKKY